MRWARPDFRCGAGSTVRKLVLFCAVAALLIVPLGRKTTKSICYWTGNTRVRIPGAVVDLSIAGPSESPGDWYTSGNIRVSEPTYDAIRVSGMSVIVDRTNRFAIADTEGGRSLPLGSLPRGYPRGYETSGYERSISYSPGLPRPPIWNQRPPPGTRVTVLFPLEIVSDGKVAVATNVASDVVFTCTESSHRGWESVLWGGLRMLGWRH